MPQFYATSTRTSIPDPGEPGCPSLDDRFPFIPTFRFCGAVEAWRGGGWRGVVGRGSRDVTCQAIGKDNRLALPSIHARMTHTATRASRCGHLDSAIVARVARPPARLM
jgi:hypothetical protein